jgi:hypothetical protein
MNAEAGKPTIAQRGRNALSRAGCLFFLAVAALFATTTLCAIVNFGWREPMFDQWREYGIYLDLTFPQNVLQSVNGHRPIVPNLIRIAEIRWLAADQLLQIGVGTLCAFVSAAILAIAVWRERSIDRVLRGAGVMLAVLGVLWLGNARRLLHGSEALHGYVPTVCALLAVWFIHDAARNQSRAWLFAAIVACVLATFSFGLGVASFCAIIAAAVLERMSWRDIGWIVAAFVLALLLYVFAVPGDAGVREQIALQPLDTARLFAQWLAGPWKAAWFDFAGDTGGSHDLAMWARPALAASARFVVGPDTEREGAACLIGGLAGIALFCVFAARMFMQPLPPTRARLLAIGAAVYALASGAITVAARTGYLQEHPDQVYADRYLLWPTMFWCALGLLSILSLARVRRRALRWTGCLALTLLPLALLVSQDRMAIWGTLVYRQGESNAAAVRSGVYDAAHFPGEAVGDAAHLREIERLKKHHLAMFADRAWQRVGTRWDGSVEDSNRISGEVRWLDPVTDTASGLPAGHFEGWITHGIARAQRFGQLAVIDSQGIIVGLAEYSFISPVAKSLLLRLPRKRGFDGYVAHPGDDATYALVLLDIQNNQAIRLATLDAFAPSVH